LDPREDLVELRLAHLERASSTRRKDWWALQESNLGQHRYERITDETISEHRRTIADEFSPQINSL
jgi:hypothetical protein